MQRQERAMKTYHMPHHWIWVTIVLLVALLTLSDVYGQQRTDAGAMFQGRPAMAGAQAGTGPMAGPPQGGIAVQGQDNAGVTLRKRSTGVADMPQGEPATPNTDAVAENRAVRNDKDVIKRDRDTGVKKDQRGVVQRAKRAVARVVQKKKHGVGDIQTAKE
jgi:hypothetical protein